MKTASLTNNYTEYWINLHKPDHFKLGFQILLMESDYFHQFNENDQQSVVNILGSHSGSSLRSGFVFTDVLRSEPGLGFCAGFSIEGPSQAKIECDDKGDGSCDVRYWPTEPGDYAIHVICDDEDIKDSPFMAHVLPAASDTFPEKVRVSLFFFLFSEVYQ